VQVPEPVQVRGPVPGRAAVAPRPAAVVAVAAAPRWSAAAVVVEPRWSAAEAAPAAVL
jgi:hypothetical protein